MDVVDFVDTRQREFIEVLKGLGDHQAAMGVCEVAPHTLTEWLEDPDFNLAYSTAREQARGMLMAKALQGLHRNLEAGKIEAIKMTLVAVDPETWNPVQRVELDTPKHRFIGFDGEPLHDAVVAPLEDPESIPEKEEDGSS